MPAFEYFYPKRSNAKTFSIAFTKMERYLADATSRLGGNSYKALLAQNIVFQELDMLVQNVVKPIYIKWAPQSPELADVGYRQQTSPKALKKSIQKWTLKGQQTVGLRMNWYGQLTLEGRGALPYKAHPDKPYPIILQSGEMIFRRRVGRATTRSGMMGPGMEGSASERMAWAQRAYEEIQSGKYMEETAKNIAYRLWAESGIYGLNEKPSGAGMFAAQDEIAKHAQLMKDLGLRAVRPVSVGMNRRGRPSTPPEVRRAQLKERKRIAREKLKENAPLRRAKARRARKVAADFKKKWDKWNEDPEFLQKHGLTHESSATEVASLRRSLRKAKSTTATGQARQQAKRASTKRGSRIVDAHAHANKLLENYNNLKGRLDRMRQYKSNTPAKILKQETRVKRAEQALHDFLQQNK